MTTVAGATFDTISYGPNQILVPNPESVIIRDPTRIMYQDQEGIWVLTNPALSSVSYTIRYELAAENKSGEIALFLTQNQTITTEPATLTRMDNIQVFSGAREITILPGTTINVGLTSLNQSGIILPFNPFGSQFVITTSPGICLGLSNLCC